MPSVIGVMVSFPFPFLVTKLTIYSPWLRWGHVAHVAAACSGGLCVGNWWDSPGPWIRWKGFWRAWNQDWVSFLIPQSVLAPKLKFSHRWRGTGEAEEGINVLTGRPIVKVDPGYFRPAEVESVFLYHRLTKDERWHHATLFSAFSSAIPQRPKDFSDGSVKLTSTPSSRRWWKLTSRLLRASSRTRTDLKSTRTS